jgi:AhpD family alkylhydroperoxidase
MVLRQLAPDFYRAMAQLDATSGQGLDPLLTGLVKVRASQLNHCTFCIDIHSRDTRRNGESEQRLYALPAWRDTPFFTRRERAALALTESVTLLARQPVPDDVYDEAEQVFSEEELAQLIALCVAINAWNRIGVTTRMTPGSRVPSPAPGRATG